MVTVTEQFHYFKLVIPWIWLCWTKKYSDCRPTFYIEVIGNSFWTPFPIFTLTLLIKAQPFCLRYVASGRKSALTQIVITFRFQFRMIVTEWSDWRGGHQSVMKNLFKKCSCKNLLTLPFLFLFKLRLSRPCPHLWQTETWLSLDLPRELWLRGSGSDSVRQCRPGGRRRLVRRDMQLMGRTPEWEEKVESFLTINSNEYLKKVREKKGFKYRRNWMLDSSSAAKKGFSQAPNRPGSPT